MRMSRGNRSEISRLVGQQSDNQVARRCLEDGAVIRGDQFVPIVQVELGLQQFLRRSALARLLKLGRTSSHEDGMGQAIAANAAESFCTHRVPPFVI